MAAPANTSPSPSGLAPSSLSLSPHRSSSRRRRITRWQTCLGRMAWLCYGGRAWATYRSSAPPGTAPSRPAGDMLARAAWADFVREEGRRRRKRQHAGKNEIYGRKEFWLDKSKALNCMASSSKASVTSRIDDRRYWKHMPTSESNNGSWAALLMGAGSSRLEKAVSEQFPEGECYFGLENFGNTCYCNSILQISTTLNVLDTLLSIKLAIYVKLPDCNARKYQKCPTIQEACSFF